MKWIETDNVHYCQAAVMKTKCTDSKETTWWKPSDRITSKKVHGCWYSNSFWRKSLNDSSIIQKPAGNEEFAQFIQHWFSTRRDTKGQRTKSHNKIIYSIYGYTTLFKFPSPTVYRADMLETLRLLQNLCQQWNSKPRYKIHSFAGNSQTNVLTNWICLCI